MGGFVASREPLPRIRIRRTLHDCSPLARARIGEIKCPARVRSRRISGECMIVRRRTRIVVGAALAAVTAWLLWSRPTKEPYRDRAAAGAVPEPRVVLSADPEDTGDPRRIGFATISGKVTDPDGRAIAGAQVCAFTSSRRLDVAALRQPTCVETGRDGGYVLAGLWAVRHRVSASAPGHIPAFYVQGEGAARRDTIDLRPAVDVRGIDIVLPGGGVEIRGTIKDLSGGAIEGALVTSGGGIEGTGVAATTSGPEGEFSLWVPPGRPRVRATAEGYADGQDYGVAPGHTFEVFLTPEAVLVGKVVRAGDGSPIEGAEVTAERGDAFAEGGRARTDAGGNFRIDRLAAGAYKPKATTDDVYGVATEQVVLGLGETSAPIVIRAHPAFYVEGRVFVAGGTSCNKGSVRLRDPAQGREHWVEIEADGVAHADGLLPGTYEVTVDCRGFVSAERYEPVVVADANATGLRWEVTRGQAIRGVIVTAKGEPMQGLRLSAHSKQDPAQPRARTIRARDSQSDAQGRFELPGLLPGTYQVYASAINQKRVTPDKPTEVTVPEGQDVEGVRLVAPTSGEVRGEVRDAHGKGLARVGVQFLGARPGPQVTTADDGTFVVREIAPGEYRVLAAKDDVLRAPGAGPDDAQGVKLEVRPGAVETVKLVVEAGSETIVGTVRGEHGEVVPDAFVEAIRESEEWGAAGRGAGLLTGRFDRDSERPRLTDGDGRFSLDGLFPGKYTVRAYRRGGGEAIAEQVAPGSEVVLTIAETGRLGGTVALPGGRAPQEFTVKVEDIRTGFRRMDSFFRTDGAWSFAELPPGTYRVQVSASEGTRTMDMSLGPGEENTGIRVELAAKVTVRGTVVDLEGRPVPGVAVQILESTIVRFGGEPGDKKHVSDAAGRFEVARAPTGLVMVQASPEEAETYASASINTRLEGGPVIELPPIRLVKKAVRSGESGGDLGIGLKQAEPGADPLQRRLTVAVVRPGSPAAAAALQVGDEIVAVGGQDVTGANYYLYWPLTLVSPGTTVRLGLARGVTVELVADAPL
ncbi:carboxypeptidase regulatory-like domain-containing protein [Nannocystis bainbridge]|uniref:Carboxypeptidase regulatory-like domain-containing protein n=1 Tax=Nannocystis bainbridge TaxID=2995303 RepID=A0ABT5DTE8_9BACT|nr:carboxypeptidase regulatory-like domain-containing protein [Nannocystis bainbridge]MDC0716413.1 carboxypeptidase regulatory-like domain-containing protein [Nannocystis bainbridge]